MKLNKAAQIVAEARGETVRSMEFPPEHWRSLRTKNPLERILREIR
jgi:transposase-like protein